MPTPYLTVADPRAAMTLYEKALKATVGMCMDGPGGMVMHAELIIGGEKIMLSGVWPGMSSAPVGRSPVNFMVQVEDADAAYQHAIAAGMTSAGDPEDMFWGERMARVNDGHGYEWMFVHQTEELSEEELGKRAAEFAKSMGG